MSTFLLVHGAMLGGWCWRDVCSGLTAAGHEAHAPTLTGQGARRAELGPSLGVDTHVDDLVELLWFEDLHDVTLVLHGYAGILAGPVVERIGDRISSVVFLGAYLTAPGECLLDVEPEEERQHHREQVASDGAGWRLPATAENLERWGITGHDLAARVGARLTDFPFRCQIEPTEFDPGPLERIPKAYVRHVAPDLTGLDRFFEAARTAGWPTREIASGHAMMLAAPERTCAVLIELSTGGYPRPEDS